jgi:hypothetical protein
MNRENLLLAFLVVLFPVHVWAIVNIFFKVPGWIVQMSMWDVAGTAAYPLAFALLESVIVFIPVVILGLILPASLRGDKFLPLITALVLLVSIWVGILHFSLGALQAWGTVELLLGLGAFLLSLVVVFVLVARSEKLSSAITAFAKRLAVLSALYLLIDIFGLIVIVVRNF